MIEPRFSEERPEFKESSGASMFTAPGLGGAFVFILLILVLRGGKKVLVDGLDRNQAPDQIVLGRDVSFHDTVSKNALAEWMKNKQNLDDILDCQKQQNLSDDELNSLLKDFWTSQNKDASVFPWQIKFGDHDWRLNAGWDVNKLKRFIETRGKGTQDR